MVGRKKAKIDWNKVDKLLEAGCTGVEIAASLGVHYDTLARACKSEKKTNFADYLQEKRASGDSLLRAAQFKSAMSGNTSMQIWLGKNRLGQSDKPNQSDEQVTDILNQLREMTRQAQDDYPDV